MRKHFIMLLLLLVTIISGCAKEEHAAVPDGVPGGAGFKFELTTENSTHTGYPFSRVIDHGVDEELGLGVAGLNVLDDLLNVCGAEMSGQSGIARYAAQEFVAGVTPAVAEPNEVGRWQ